MSPCCETVCDDSDDDSGGSCFAPAAYKEVECQSIPEGWKRFEQTLSSGTVVSHYYGPGGEYARSKVGAWRVVGESPPVRDVPRESAPPVVSLSEVSPEAAPSPAVVPVPCSWPESSPSGSEQSPVLPSLPPLPQLSMRLPCSGDIIEVWEDNKLFSHAASVWVAYVVVSIEPDGSAMIRHHSEDWPPFESSLSAFHWRPYTGKRELACMPPIVDGCQQGRPSRRHIRSSDAWNRS